MPGERTDIATYKPPCIYCSFGKLNLVRWLGNWAWRDIDGIGSSKGSESHENNNAVKVPTVRPRSAPREKDS